MARVTEFEQALIGRDEISRTEAKKRRAEARSALYDILANGGDYDDVEEMMAGEYGLEMDYIFDLM